MINFIIAAVGVYINLSVYFAYRGYVEDNNPLTGVVIFAAWITLPFSLMWGLGHH